MKNLSSLTLIILFLLTYKATGQTTITLKPGAAQGKDALVLSGLPNFNSEPHPETMSITWTCGGSPCTDRALIEFDLSSIPANATIISAYLSLYANTNPITVSQAMYGSANTSVIQRVTSSWTENSVTWNTQPTVDPTNQVILQQSIQPFQDYLNNDVTLMVQDMINNPSSSFGFRISLQNENYYNAMIFASSDYSNPSKFPELTITYDTVPSTCITLKPGAANGKDALILSGLPTTNTEPHPESMAIAWTCGGSPCNDRALIQFDLTSIPANAIITSARLGLYANPTPITASPSMYGSNNATLIQRITSAWNEGIVTWSTQPTTVTLNQVTLPHTSVPYQDYLNIIVTNLVQDMIADPVNSHGFMLKLVNENAYNAKIFASSDYADPAYHPELEICYTVPSNVSSTNIEVDDISVYPNPFNSFISLTIPNGKKLKSVYTISIYDFLGKTIDVVESFSKDGNQLSYNLNDLPKGMYNLVLKGNDEIYTKKIIKN